MLYSVLALSLLVCPVIANQNAASKTAAPQKQDQPRQVEGFIAPSEVNVRIGADSRALVVMAAVNLAGFNYETGGQPLSPARAELRKDLAGIDPALKARLTEYYNSHRRQGVDEVSDALRYEALSMLMTQPPAFSIYTPKENMPQDLQPLLDFVPLVQDFYLKSGIKAVLPKYIKLSELYAQQYRIPVGESIYVTLNYFHTTPDTIINMKPIVISNAAGEKKREMELSRTRFVFVTPDPLLPIGSSLVRDDVLNQREDLIARKVGDDYTVVVGPSTEPLTTALKQALIRFVIDPILVRHLKASLEYKDQILKLEQTALPEGNRLGSSVYLIMRNSFGAAADARFKMMQSARTGVPYTQDDAVFDLARAYQGGSVLAFHFFDALAGYEKVGIGIEDFVEQMLATTDWDKEAARPQEFGPIVARVREARAKAPTATEEAAARPIEGLSPELTSKIVLSDELIRDKKYDQAQPVLEEVLKTQPDNARALYGMARVLNVTPSKVELDPKSDENDKIEAQYRRLQQSVKFFNKAIEKADAKSEAWLIQWSHVYIGRILDFQEFRNDAVAEYQKAVAIGDIPNGAYKEALEGKEHPFGQK